MHRSVRPWGRSTSEVSVPGSARLARGQNSATFPGCGKISSISARSAGRGARDHAAHGGLGCQPGRRDLDLAQRASQGELAESGELLEVRVLEQMSAGPGQSASLRATPLRHVPVSSPFATVKYSQHAEPEGVCRRYDLGLGELPARAVGVAEVADLA
jgi:hypothetical protein